MDLSQVIQKFQTTLAPRLGGLPILIGLSVAWFMPTPEIKHILTPILLEIEALKAKVFFGKSESLLIK